MTTKILNSTKLVKPISNAETKSWTTIHTAITRQTNNITSYSQKQEMNREAAHDFSPKLIKKLQQHRNKELPCSQNQKTPQQKNHGSSKKNPSVES
jgi:hypothetical protein